MERFEIHFKNQFFIDKSNKTKMITYQSFRYNAKHKTYGFYNKYEKIKLGVQLCDFLNTDFHSFESAKTFVDKYSITTIADLANLPIYQYYDKNEYQDMIQNVVSSIANKLEKYKKAFIEDIKYIYNLNDLEELSNLSPAKRLHILKNSKKVSEIIKIYDSKNLKLSFNNFGDFTALSITEEEDAQEVAKILDVDTLAPYCFTSTNIIQTFIIELAELTSIDNIEIKQCKNCGKYFVPDNRADEIYCSNIYENGKTCKEVGHFRTKQKLMKENDDLRIYRNVYQKLLLRTRRNPMNDEYEKEFIEFKKKNAELKEKISNGRLTQEEYMKWLNEQ